MPTQEDRASEDEDAHPRCRLAASVVVLAVSGRLLLGEIGVVDLAQAAAEVCGLGRLQLNLFLGKRTSVGRLFGPVGLGDVSGRRVRTGNGHGGSLTVTSVIKVWSSPYARPK